MNCPMHSLHHAGTVARGDRAPAEFILGLLRDFGLDAYYLELSTRDPESDKFIGTDE